MNKLHIQRTTVFFEYAYNTAKLARKEGLFNTFVINGYMTPEAIKTIAPYLDTATVNFKGGGNPEFYRIFCDVPDVNPIFECLSELKRYKVHVEITNLVVPHYGDSVKWLRD
jgi:pyruvate formate lyase activating enzyme